MKKKPNIWFHTSALLVALILVSTLLLTLASAPAQNQADASWTVTGSLGTGRYAHTATLLPNGKVLIVGGSASGNVFNSAELYDPATGAWTVTGSMSDTRSLHTATLLANDKVLVAGGYTTGHGGVTGSLSSAELYDPATGIWTTTGSLGTARASYTATLLLSGRVLVAGGFNTRRSSYLRSAEVYHPAAEIWTTTANLNTGREVQTATELPSGNVLVAGGLGDSGYLSSAELYDPAEGIWSDTGRLGTARDIQTTALLPIARCWWREDSKLVEAP